MPRRCARAPFAWNAECGDAGKNILVLSQSHASCGQEKEEYEGRTMNSKLYPALYAPKDGYVFVVTYGRSGSTLTQSLLNSIPGYCIRGENGNLAYFLSRAVYVTSTWDNYLWRRADRNKPAAEQQKFLKDILGTPRDPWYGAENVDSLHFSRSLMDVFVRDILAPPEGTRVSGFKEIRFHEDRAFFLPYLKNIKESFPKARFIFQTRDPENVSKSSWWGTREKSDVLEIIENAEKLFHEFSDRNPNVCFTVQYERYAEGSAYVSEIFDFLGEKVDRAAISEVLNKKLKH